MLIMAYGPNPSNLYIISVLDGNFKHIAMYLLKIGTIRVFHAAYLDNALSHISKI